jgi:hypothetical protein
VGANIDTGAGSASVPILQADQWTLAAGLVAKIGGVLKVEVAIYTARPKA